MEWSSAEADEERYAVQLLLIVNVKRLIARRKGCLKNMKRRRLKSDELEIRKI